IWISPARGSTQGGSAQGKGGDAGVAKVRAAGQRIQRRRSRVRHREGRRRGQHLLDLDLTGERQHTGRQGAGEGRRRRGCEGEGGGSEESEESSKTERE
ncbi:hypothetical protein U1Q18_049341, partial [Sarracenia purpurea var. burkii]